MAKEVAWPWPCEEVPTEMVAPPSGSMRTEPYSLGAPPPVISTYTATPIPSSMGSSRSRRRACSARSSS